jgi:hypothetical protein
MGNDDPGLCWRGFHDVSPSQSGSRARSLITQREPIEKINEPFLKARGSSAEYGAGLALAIGRGCFWKYESGTYVKFISAGAELFA